MDKHFEELFVFLEQSPYFYEKQGNFIAETGGVKNNKIIYTFFTQERPYQAIAEIAIPLDPMKDVQWKFIQFNGESTKATYQARNEHLYYIPTWFRRLVLKVRDIYNDIAVMFRLLA